MAWKDSGKYSGLRDIKNIRGNLGLESFEKRVFPGKKKNLNRKEYFRISYRDLIMD